MTLCLTYALLSSLAPPPFESIVPAGAELRRVATGFQFVEGPTWEWSGERLLFSDIPASRIYALTADGETSVYAEPSLQSNGTFLDRDGFLLACRHEARDVVRFDSDGSVREVLAEWWDDKHFNSPNDLVVTPEGVIWFTDPRYGSTGQVEQESEAVYRLGTDGVITRVIDDMRKPNGIFVSPDGTRLYVADSERGHIRVYPIAEDGTVGAGRELCRLDAPEEGVPDGMTLDDAGNIYCTGSGGVWIFTPEGEKIGRIDTPEVPANCCFGGADGRTLWITARSSVYAIDLNARGSFPTKQ